MVRAAPDLTWPASAAAKVLLMYASHPARSSGRKPRQLSLTEQRLHHVSPATYDPEYQDRQEPAIMNIISIIINLSNKMEKEEIKKIIFTISS